jgi:hypothetical protein
MCFGGDDNEQPTIQYSEPPKSELYSSVQEPWSKSQYQLYQDVFEPTTRSLGGILGEQLTQPLSLPEDVWSNLWQKARAKTVGEYGQVRQQATERAAGSGMLGQGATEKYFQNLDLSQAKSIEDLAVDMSIAEWNEKKQAQQQALSNAMNFVNQQPVFNLPYSTANAYSSMGDTSSGNYSGLGTGIGMLGGALLAPLTGGLSIPMGAMLGGSLGGSIGGMINY